MANKEQKRYVVGLGEALFDCLPEGSKLGGAPANFAYHVSQFGFDAMAISALGNDMWGDQARTEFDEKKLNYIMPTVDYPTGTVQVTLDDEGVPTYDIKTDVAWDNIPFTPEVEAVAKNARAVCFDRWLSATRCRKRPSGSSWRLRQRTASRFSTSICDRTFIPRKSSANHSMPAIF